MTTEDRVLNALQTLPGVGSLPIKSVRIGRDPASNVSRGVCYLDMNSTGDAMRLFAGLSDAGRLIIDGREGTVLIFLHAFLWSSLVESVTSKGYVVLDASGSTRVRNGKRC